MTKKIMFLLLACASFMGLTACSNTAGSVKASSSETSAGSDKGKKNLSAEVTESNGDDGKKVMTINVTGDIPVADSDGETAGAKQKSDVTRKTVTFGNFCQDKAGENLTPVKWIVLDEQDGYSLLMTEQIIASNGWMNDSDEGKTWAETDLRKWLDDDFYNTAFSEDEKSHMAMFSATQLQNPRYDTPAGEATVDPVSLLSYQELVYYMPTDDERKTSPTDYAVEQGCYQNPDGDAAWWLRSPGPESNVPEHLASWGNLGARTHYINDGTIGVRPVVWVESSALTE